MVGEQQSPLFLLFFIRVGCAIQSVLCGYRASYSYLRYHISRFDRTGCSGYGLRAINVLLCQCAADQHYWHDVSARVDNWLSLPAAGSTGGTIRCHGVVGTDPEYYRSVTERLEDITV